MEADQGPLRVRVVIPHYCSDQGDENGYGSTRPGSRDKRIAALGRTLGALRSLTMRSCMEDYIFNHKPEDVIVQPGPVSLFSLAPNFREPRPLDLTIIVCVTGENWLDGALRAYAQDIHAVQLDVQDPIMLGLAARDFLLKSAQNAHLSMYLEDDLVIHDSYFFDKQAWFIERSAHQAVLMPHRYELSANDKRRRRRLFVDGSIDQSECQRFPWMAELEAARGQFLQQPVVFDLANNPHSGCFVISALQAKQLQDQSQ